jgi:cytochrome c556
MTKTVNLVTTLELQTCIACGITFAAPESFLDTLRENHKNFYCPNGHGQHFAQQSEAEKAQAEAEKYKKLWNDEQRYASEVLKERNAAQRQLSATKGQMTKLKQRVANGVCPCCHRSFVNLHRHMQGQHPDYTKE